MGRRATRAHDEKRERRAATGTTARDEEMANENQNEALAVLARLSEKNADSLERRHELVADLGIDSPRALELLVELEEALGVEISDEEAARMETVGDVLDYAASVGR